MARTVIAAAGLAELWRERLAHYKLPREFRIVDPAALPRSSTGKIQRHEVERWLAQEHA